jgi:regulator of chromosome condensation
MVCADSFSAVLTRDGDVFAWGSFRDPGGILGFNKSMEKRSQRFPCKITAFGQKKIVLLGSGENHVFAVAEDDTLWAFGANDENQLGRRVRF